MITPSVPHGVPSQNWAIMTEKFTKKSIKKSTKKSIKKLTEKSTEEPTRIPTERTTRSRLRVRYCRIVIPNLREYQSSSDQQLRQLKFAVLQRLITRQTRRGLQYYRIALEHHQNGVPHLDILLTYQASRLRYTTDWDYLLRHGDLTVYRQLNRAIIQYGCKQDRASLTNIPDDISFILTIQRVRRDPYSYLLKKMQQDPLHFNLQDYVYRHDLSPHIRGWSAVKTKLRDMQLAAANHALRSRPGIAPITRARVQACLTPAQLAVYDSWQGYATIIDYLNQIPQYCCKRPFKSRQLLLVGRANSGKTSLINALERYYAIYHMDVTNWFPRYNDGIYPIISWNQFKLKGGMTHTTLLKYLQGYPVDLQYKGGSALRRDNQLIIMTSNMTLQQHICLKFRDPAHRIHARSNLGARIHELIIPADLNLFILQKLISVGRTE